MRRFLTVFLLLICASSAFAQIDTTKWYVVNPIKDDGNWCHFTANQNVSGGYLTLTATSGSYACNPGGTGVPYATGMIFSLGSTPFSFTYGVAKARVKFGTAGNTIWSAFWMWGGGAGSNGAPATCLANVQAPGNTMNACTVGTSTPSYEIDIAEDRQSTTTTYSNYLTWVNGASTPGSAVLCTPSSDIGSGFHIYELDWYPNLLVYKVDGLTCGTQAISISVPMFLIFDTEQPSSSTATTTTVDWVRVCSSPTAQCNPGDSTMIFDDEFNNGVAAVKHSVQGEKKQGAKIQ
ncbi:MAG TPA: hypothetical protein VGT04_07005 [Acidobacteriaceae bacterium]|nr:hypothetical protein [Acidobacteriaceae bacterium]